MKRYGSKEWTPDEDDLLRKLVLKNCAPADIAIDLKRSLPAIKARAHRLGISLRLYKSK
jgi:hypothetical protein